MLKTDLLNEQSFKPFGLILSTPNRTPDVTGEIHEYWDKLSLLPGETSINYLTAKSRALCLKELERHTQTPEILVLLEGSCFLPVASAGELASEKIRVFRMKPGDAVQLDAGTWHWIPFPQQGTSRFMVIYKNGTAQNDLEIVPLAQEKIFEN